jgi:DNA-binding SARP family transcriptional activator/WD40 repeat protein
MGIAVLGPLQVNGGSTNLAPRERVVLEALVVRHGEVVSSDQLADALWGEHPPATWRKALQTAIVRLRRLLGAAAIDTVDHGYRLSLPPREVDVPEFERLVGRARELLGRGEPDRAAYTLDQALGLWRGAALADLYDWEPGRQEADRLTELRADAEELRVDAALRSGRHREVLSVARRLVEPAPLRERRWELLALAQYRCGQQADALHTLHQLRRTLVSELGLDPGPDAVALEQAILRQDPSLQPGAAVLEPDQVCPYLGLVPYDVADAEAFFGRDEDIEACRRRLAETGVLAVVGPSGSGKSSLVRAGLAAALRADGERVVVVTPGRRPLAALSAAPTTGRPALLVVDQVEEAVTLCDDPSEVEQFFAALTAYAARGRLVVALRADRFGDLAVHAAFARLVEQSLYVLTPMTADALREAIEGPARQARLRLEAGLVELLVAEVEGQPGALPHLSHALRQTWERREGGVLTIDGYRATGGIREAVARSAERVHEDLPVDERVMLRDVMLRLVSPSPEGDPVRSRIPRRLLTIDAEHDRLLEQLVVARLVTSDDGVVELAHEALARSWPRLQGWLDEDTEGQRIMRHLAVAADTWAAMGRPDDELYRGTRLAQALEWRDRSAPDITPLEADFLAAGDRRAQQEVQSALSQATYQARVNRRLRGLLIGAAMLLIMALVAGTLAVRQANRAADATDTAVAQRATAQAQLAGNVDQALGLAAAAATAEPSAETRAGLLAVLARSPQLSAVRSVPGVWMDVSPADGTIATISLDNTVRVYDPATYEETGEYDPYPDRPIFGIGGNLAPLAFSSDGSQLAVALLAVDHDVVRLLDPETARPLPEQPGGQPKGAIAHDVEFSRDGRYLAASVYVFSGLRRPDGSLAYVWDLARPQRPLHTIVVPGDPFHVEFSPDGRRLHAAPGDSSDAYPGLWTYSTRTGELLGSSRTGGQGLESSADGRTLAYAVGSTAYLLDERTGAVLQRLEEPQAGVERLSFSQDGRLVAAVSEDQAHVWEVATGRLREHIALDFAPTVADFDQSGDRLLVPLRGRLHVFDLTGRDRYLERIHTGDPDLPAGFQQRSPSPHNPVVAIVRWVPRLEESVVSVAEQEGEVPVSRLGLGGLPALRAWSPDGRHLALVSSDGLAVYDWRSGEVVGRKLAADFPEYTSDGSRLFVLGHGGLVLRDAATLRKVTEPVPVPGDVWDARLGPGEDTVVVLTVQRKSTPGWSFNAADRWRLVDLVSGRTIRSGRVRTPANALAVAADGTRMAVAGYAGLGIVDLDTGRATYSPDSEGSAEGAGLQLEYSPDGGLLASSDWEGKVSLWDGRTARLLGTVQPGDTTVLPMFLDDNRLLLQYHDGASYVWDTSEQHAMDTACRILGSGLDEAEWRTWFGNRDYIDTCAG